jgi:diketogulonate reductase-like aldo/keto reductase
MVGLGTYQVKGEVCTAVVLEALKIGYTSIDTATVYRNGNEIGEAVRCSGIKRENMFITSKIGPSEQGESSAYDAVLRNLAQLGTGYIDLMLIHWPGVAKTSPSSELNRESRKGSWRGLMRAKHEGLVRDIGVSNFNISHLEDFIYDPSLEVPAVNQVELHPLCTQMPLRNFCSSHGIVVQAYSSLGSGANELLHHPLLQNLSVKYNISCSELLLLWAIQQNIPVLPKTKSINRLSINLLLQCNNVKLLEQDIEDISNLNEDHHFCWNPINIA